MAFPNLHSRRAPPHPLDVCQTRPTSRLPSEQQLGVCRGKCWGCVSVICLCIAPGGSYLSRTVSLTANSPTGPTEQPGFFQFAHCAIYSRVGSNF